MDRKELEQKVIELVAMSYDKKVEDLSTETSFKDDLKGASVQMVGLVAELENELDVTIALQDASACATIGDLVDKVEEEME
jgi:acyl carrier protein